MARIRRVAAVAGACALAAAFTAAPAGAATPEVYTGSAAGQALVLGAFGQSLTLGTSTAKAASTPSAQAEGAGMLLPQQAGYQKAGPITGAGSDSKPESCATPPVPSPLSGIVTFGLGCSTVSASVVGGVPKASGSGSVASLGVNSSTALQPLGAVTTQIGSALSTILGQICSGGRQLCPVTTTVSDLLTSVLNTKTLDVQLGNSTSSVTVETSKVTSATSASGAVIKILPLPVVNGVASTTPFVTITVGSAKASVVYDRTTGVATPTKDPAIVRINFNTALNAAGLPAEIAVPVGQTKTILLGTPLETTITVADGTARVNADHTANATADGVKVELFKGLQGGITLNLAHAEAAGGGAPATKDAPAPPPNAELPRTGGTPWLPIAGAGFLGLAVLVRRATAKAVRA